jgi:3-methyl-2-oxobutanoate hydroxymethyltransferase
MSYQLSVDEAFAQCRKNNERNIRRRSKAGGGEQYAETVKKISDAGIPVLGHIGYTPQSIHQFGSYREREEKQKTRSCADNERCQSLEEAGLFCAVCA